VTARRLASPKSSGAGLPTMCGVKLPDGRECRRRAGPFGACEEHADPARRPWVPSRLSPERFEQFYLFWLKEQGRERVLPDDLQRFLCWWSTYPVVNKVQVPFTMDIYRLQNWWLVWCRLSSHERLTPFDLTLFMEWWKVT